MPTPFLYRLTFIALSCLLVCSSTSCKKDTPSEVDTKPDAASLGISYTQNSPQRSKVSGNIMMSRTPYVLPDGRVLLAGGGWSNDNRSYYRLYPEIYDPATNTWTVLPNEWIPSHTRYGGRIVPMKNGHLLYIPGQDAMGNWQTAFYEILPQNSWVSKQHMPPAVGSAAAQIVDGGVCGDGTVFLIEKSGHYITWNPTTDVMGTWVDCWGIGGRDDFFESRVVSLPGGEVMIIGQDGLESDQRYKCFLYPSKRVGATLTNRRCCDYDFREDGKLVIAGQFNTSAPNEIYDEATNSFSLDTAVIKEQGIPSYNRLTGREFCALKGYRSFGLPHTFLSNLIAFSNFTHIDRCTQAGAYISSLIQQGATVVKLSSTKFMIFGYDATNSTDHDNIIIDITKLDQM